MTLELSEKPAELHGTEPRSLAENAYDILIDQILARRLKPGQMLNERSLSVEMNISRTPIREALTRLESEGFVTRHNGRLITVRDFSAQEIMYIFHVRSILEVDGIKYATDRISDETLDKLETIFERQTHGPVPDAGNHWDADDLLHDSIAEATGNTVLAELVKNLRRKTQMFNLKRMPERFLPGNEEHLTIIRALRSRDVAAAQAAMSRHLDNSRQSVLNVISKL